MRDCALFFFASSLVISLYRYAVHFSHVWLHQPILESSVCLSHQLNAIDVDAEADLFAFRVVNGYFQHSQLVLSTANVLQACKTDSRALEHRMLPSLGTNASRFDR
jgi:hypothetical protein